MTLPVRRGANLAPATPAPSSPQEPEEPEEAEEAEEVRGMSDNRRTVDARRLWVGGIMAGVVGAGVAIVGLLLARGIADIPVLVEQEGELVNPSTWWYALVALLAAVLATALLHVLLVAAPRPFTFYGWITGLAVAIAVLLPYTTGASLASKIATSLINLAIGVVVAGIIASVGRSAVRVPDGWSDRPSGPAARW